MNKLLASIIVIFLVVIGLFVSGKIEEFKEGFLTGITITTFNNTQTSERLNFTGLNETQTRWLVIDMRYQIKESWLNISGSYT